MADDSLLTRVIDVLNTHDPMGLNPGGHLAPDLPVPWDEYRAEAEDFAAILASRATVTATDVDTVWRKWFTFPAGDAATTEQIAADLRALVA